MGNEESQTIVEITTEDFLKAIPWELKQLGDYFSTLQTAMLWSTLKARYHFNGSGFTLYISDDEDEICHISRSPQGIIQVLVRPGFTESTKLRLESFPGPKIRIGLITVPDEISW